MIWLILGVLYILISLPLFFRYAELASLLILVALLFILIDLISEESKSRIIDKIERAWGDEFDH